MTKKGEYRHRLSPAQLYLHPWGCYLQWELAETTHVIKAAMESDQLLQQMFPFHEDPFPVNYATGNRHVEY
jgi:hypothetical protein